MLLAVETKEQIDYVDDDTVEGACVLMQKVGYLLEEKLQKKDSDKKGASTSQRYENIFKRFVELSEENSICSLRLRMIIKNTLEDRSKGWEKAKNQSESGPKKVDELRKELE